MFSFNRSVSDGTLKLLLAFSHFMTWASSAIVVGITGYFIKKFDRNQHLTFWIVIGALTLAFWLPSFAIVFHGSYKSWYLCFNFVFSYLWLTAFIFAAQDYNLYSCHNMSPTNADKCTLKKTNESFIFLAFFFTLCGYLIENHLWKKAATPAADHPGKERVSDATGTA